MAATSIKEQARRVLEVEKMGDGPLGWVRSHPLLSIGLLALTLRLAAVALTNLAAAGQFAQDDSTYITLAENMAESNLGGWTGYEFQLWRGTMTFLWPLRGLFEVFGSVQWIGQIYVTLWGTATAVLVTAVGLRFISYRLAIAAGLVVAVLPSQVLWSSLILKDAAVWAVLAGLALVVAGAVGATGRYLILLGAASFILLLGLAHLREHSLIIAAWAIVPTALLGNRATRIPRGMVGLAFALFLPALTGLGPGGWSLLTDPDFAEKRARNAQYAQSAFVQEVPVSPNEAEGEGAASLASEIAALKERLRILELEAAEAKSKKKANQLQTQISQTQQVIKEKEEERPPPEPLDAEEPPIVAPDGSFAGDDTVSANISHLPDGLRVMLLEPLPWREPTSSNMNLARFENLIWYPLLVLALIGLPRAWRYRGVLAFPFLAGGGILIAYALSEGNIGTAYRHRGEFVWVVALLAPVGIEWIRESTARKRARQVEPLNKEKPNSASRSSGVRT